MPHINVHDYKGITSDSRQVKEGYIFAALPGVKVNGLDFIDDAIAKGADAVLVSAGTTVGHEGITVIEDKNPRRAFALLAAEFYGAQPEYIVAVTGTNGKTSVVTFAQQLWEALGYKAASMGTLSGALTTLDPVALHEKLAGFTKDGITHLALEASSHGLDQHRLDGVKVGAAGFTNLSRDHLDYHETEEAYLAAKSRLFSSVLEEEGVAVLNADVPQYGELRQKNRGAHEISYGFNGSVLKLLKAEPVPEGQALSLDVAGARYDFTLPLVGAFQVMNALCALGLVMAGDPQNAERNAKLVKALEALKPVRGRLEYVAGHPQGAGIYVDYAHTPDALENILTALRPHTEGRLICVFGCGGDRDKGKRPQMGDIASRLSDEAIVTDDNPRSEDPAQIRKEIMAAVSKGQEIGGRRHAIKAAVQMLSAGDVLVIAGKGHEQGQIFADRTDPFDDVSVTKEILNEIKNPQSGETNE